MANLRLRNVIGAYRNMQSVANNYPSMAAFVSIGRDGSVACNFSSEDKIDEWIESFKPYCLAVFRIHNMKMSLATFRGYLKAYLY